MTTYELWHHELLGAYCIRVEGGQVTGVCGSFRLAQVDSIDPRKCRYADWPEAILHVQCEPDRFCMTEAWHKRPWPVSDLPLVEPPGLWDRVRAWAWPRRTKKMAP
jgi:hypothetical protein